MRFSLLIIAMMALVADAMAQDTSANTGVRRRDTNKTDAATTAVGVTERAHSRYGKSGDVSDSDVQWMRVIYRQIDLNDDKNAALYFPEEPIDGQENLFRIIMRLLCDSQIPAYEYLDGREIFTDKYKVKVSDVLDRFHIYYTQGKGSNDKVQHLVIDESDVPTNEVLSYYVIERWVYDTRTNRMKTYIDAICPVLHRAGDFGGDPIKYPMFWVKFEDLRPYLAQQQIFVSDDNNLPTCTYDDFFNLTMYNGDIYKTRNLRNQSLMQIYPDPDDLKRAQDSIQAYLDNFEAKLWVPDREELLARQEAEKTDPDAQPTLDDVVAAPVTADETAADTSSEPAKTVRTTKRGGSSDKSKDNKSSANKDKKSATKSKDKKKSSKVQKSSSSSSGPARSVRRKK